MCCTRSDSSRIPPRPTSAVAAVLAFRLLVPPGAGALSFDPRLDLSVGTAPLGVGIGDIDGDGKQDLVVAAHEDDTVAVFLNTSSTEALSFAAKVDAPTGLHPQGVAVVDLDGDGKPEIVTANSGRGGGGSMSVLVNTSSPGVISFAPRRDFPVDTAHRVAAGDLDGDGRLDLAVSANSPRMISLFRNSSSPGSLSISRVLDLPTANFPNSVAIADVDGDGKPEVLAPIGGVNVLSVYLNRSSIGSFSFSGRTDFPVTDSANGIGVGDFDGDSQTDVIVGSGGSSFVTLLLNGSSPGNLSFTRHDFAAGPQPTCHQRRQTRG